MKTLIIVESPTKARTIAKFLDSNYIVESSFGHVRDLPKSKLGIDVDNNFEPSYVIPTKAKSVVKNLKEKSKGCDMVILATDEDREGEAIAWHLREALGIKESQRIAFHEITKTAILDALKHPRALDLNMVNAQQARRALDRIVGYKLSPFLWKKVARGLSAGRVQSVAVRLIVERENEIRAFKSEEYWSVDATLAHAGTKQNIEASLTKIKGETLDKFAIPTKDRADEIKADLEKQDFVITAVTKKEIKKNPLAPFTTSTLQQEAAKRLGYTAKKTMMLAQQLYEQGAITYMRTDSVNLSKESLAAAKVFLTKEYGAEYAAQAPRVFTTKSKSAQEAHEAVRPTDPSVTDMGENKLYRLIWQRFMASQMPQAIFDNTGIDIAAGQYGLRAAGAVLKFDGYLKVWAQKFEDKEMPAVKNGEALDCKEILAGQHFTEPPARYSEASLVKTLEEYGIGRPSTYAPIISVIQTREYVVKDKGRFHPTPTGEKVNAVLVAHFPETTDINFTANMENTLDAVALGTEQWRDVLGSFYTPFMKNLTEKYESVKGEEIIKPAAEPTDQICEKCGKPMVIRSGRFGKFVACSGFPACKNTKRTEPDPNVPQIPCPDCKEGSVIDRRTGKGRTFWGCSRYPECKYATWKNPNEPEKKAAEANTEAETKETSTENEE
ncbi:MAG: type I DNA topoisomerase [Candidatus Pacebacteria bacterium]|nr:type I DNA topoisomerase [Candidatus Paceibacterota bacterium]